MIFFKILIFHDISMTGKLARLFPGFPGAVATLYVVCPCHASTRQTLIKLMNLSAKIEGLYPIGYIEMKIQIDHSLVFNILNE